MNSCLLNELEPSFEWLIIGEIMENVITIIFRGELSKVSIKHILYFQVLLMMHVKAIFLPPFLIGRDVQSHDLIGSETIFNIINRKSAIQKCICIYPDMRN